MISEFENDRIDPPEPDPLNDNDPEIHFLIPLQNWQLGRKTISPENLPVKSSELPDISIDDYPEIETYG